MPNCMRGFASAAQVSNALSAGVQRGLPGAAITAIPLADGGDGTLDILQNAVSAVRHETVAADAFGTPRAAEWLSLGDGTAVVEAARICGLADLRPDQTRPLQASSAGVGEVISEAISQGASQVLLGLGGTAVADGGAGCLAALGARFLASDGQAITPVPGTILQVAGIDLNPVKRLLRGVKLRLLSDVSIPLAKSILTFGAQKGVTAATRPSMLKAIEHLADLLASADPVCGSSKLRQYFHQPWRGAGGGIGFGLSAVATAQACSGSAELLALVDPGRVIDTAPWAITAEGKVDTSTWLGKIPGAVAERRADNGLPTAILAAAFDSIPRSPLITYHLVNDPSASGQCPLRGPVLLAGLARAAEEASRQAAESREHASFARKQ